MDYIDWIISSFVFLLMVSLVLLTISNIIPITQKDDFFSKSIFISSVETIPVYNISINNPDNEIYPYSFSMEQNGNNQNIYKTIDGKLYGVIKNSDKFFEYDFQESFDSYGILALNENFNDFDYSDSFSVSQDTNINAGILELKTPTTITTNSEFYDFFGFLSTTNALIVYVSYTDVNNNYFCRFGDSTITIGKTENSTQTTLKTTSYSKATDWHKVYFGYTKDNLIICSAGETESEYLDSNNVSKTQIVISSIYNNTLIDDFYIYLNNDIYSNSSGTITGNYIDANITDNLITIKITDRDLSSILDFNFTENLEVIDGNGISFVKDSEEENKLLFFPQTKEFLGYKDSEEVIEINLDENTGFNLDISEIEDLALWVDASNLDLNDGDLVGSWTDLSGNDYHATQSTDGNKPTFKENILNGKPVVRFDGENFLQTNEFLSTLEQPNTFFIIFTANENPGYIIFDGITDGNRNAFGSSGPGTTTVSLFAGVVLNSSQLLPQDWSVWTGLYDNTNSQILKNGILENQGDIGSQNLTGLTIGCRFSLTRFLIGDIAEILIYDSALSDSNRLLVENYLSQKYAIDVENGLSFTNNYIELINLNDNNKIMKMEFLDKETNEPVDCNCEYKNKKITIGDCESDVVIKTRFRSNGLIPTNPKPKITKTIEQVITKEKFDTLSNQSYYIRLFNNTLNLENRTNRPSTNFYKNFTKLLWSNGFLEEVAVEIKS